MQSNPPSPQSQTRLLLASRQSTGRFLKTRYVIYSPIAHSHQRWARSHHQPLPFSVSRSGILCDHPSLLVTPDYTRVASSQYRLQRVGIGRAATVENLRNFRKRARRSRSRSLPSYMSLGGTASYICRALQIEARAIRLPRISHLHQLTGLSCWNESLISASCPAFVCKF